MQPFISVVPRSEGQGETCTNEITQQNFQCNGARPSPQTF